jgi:2-hydroxychromene-2-carboxylate isomerase
MTTVKALRVHLALPEERRAAYRARVFRAYWAEDRDIADDAILAACVGDEPAARDALARSQSDAVKAELRAETETAAARGVFGVPTMIVSGGGASEELYWGQDRLELVEDALVAERPWTS